MSNLISGISFSLFHDYDFDTRSIAEMICSVLLASSKVIRPKKFGAFSPDKRIDSIDDIVDTFLNRRAPESGLRAGSLVLEASRRCGYQVQWNKSDKESFPYIGGHLLYPEKNSKHSDESEFIDLVRKLVETSSPVYGEIRSMSEKYWDSPVNLTKRLPDVPSISIYGDRYISLFGKSSIENAPFLRIEKLKNSYWLVAGEPIDAGVPEACRKKVRDYFGEDAFMSGGKWRYQSGRAPIFDLSFSVTK